MDDSLKNVLSKLRSILQHWWLFGILNLLKSQRIIIGYWCILLSKLTMFQIEWPYSSVVYNQDWYSQ